MENWVFHVQTREKQQEADITLTDLLKTFLGSFNESSVQYQAWGTYITSAHGYGIPRAHPSCKVPAKRLAPLTTPIWSICAFSFYNLLRDWWDKAELELSQLNKRGQNLLIVAAEAGCMKICDSLINRGIQLNYRLEDREFGSALTAAACRGHDQIVKYLVGKGADVKMVFKYGPYGCALVAAAKLGRTQIVQFLVENGADVNMMSQNDFHDSALAAAASLGDIQILEFLLEKGVDVNAQGGRYGSALAAAVCRGNIKTLKFLFEKGADVNMVLLCGHLSNSTALAAARISDIINYLLGKGADVGLVTDQNWHKMIYRIHCLGVDVSDYEPSEPLSEDW